MKSSKHSFTRVLQNNWFILKYGLRYSRKYIIFACLYACLQEIEIFLEHFILIKFVFDSVQYGASFTTVAFYIGLMVLFIAMCFILDSIYFQSVEPKGKELLYRQIRMELYEKAIKTDLANYDDPAYYNDYVWSANDAHQRIDATINNIQKICRAFTVIVTSVSFFLFVDQIGLLFVLVSFLSTLLVSMMANKIRYKMKVELNEKDRKRIYLKRLFYLADYAKEMRLYSIKERFFKDFSIINQDMQGIVRKHSKKQFWLNFSSDYFFNELILGGLYVIYIVFMTLVKGTLSYGSAITLLNSSWRLKGNMQYLTALISEMQENSLYIEKLRSFLEQENALKEAADAAEMPDRFDELKLSRVSFQYGTTGPRILHDVDLSIRPGEKIAIVGYNGAGKTTLTKLIMRLYDASEGEIRLNGTPINQFKIDDYRMKFSSVFQDHQLFAATLSENVVMDKRASGDAGNVREALKKSGFGDKLMSLRLGEDTAVTREFDESGIELSGGEAQKVAISRVFAKPTLLILLDEPSSALDPMSEYHLNRVMLEEAEDRPIIFISHRLSTTKMVDRIYMMENGAIIEQGSHDELMKLNGKYAHMFNLQASRYRVVVGERLA
ncbi:ABC transporter ATP-binding protein [Paenibacillus soyae]|uniref:ABC transporter ATP-binding protein/permease n=1 Tax=Paenibacillus soyae TaxID=2969249 RepID=A0A9X2MV26_9BACL|nr:ABC transporter ATP-binding protein [Paenibacillus soyae]MCR2806819.1 ABC transporter ATP-binding protein/permease [Paenibacillus soyae]